MTNEKDVKIVPTLGRIVLYKLSADDVHNINRRRLDAGRNLETMRELKTGYQAHFGNEVQVGQEVSGSVVAVWGENCINIKIDLDGTDCLWVTSANLGESEGNWYWMAYQKGQAKKHEADEEKKEV